MAIALTKKVLLNNEAFIKNIGDIYSVSKDEAIDRASALIENHIAWCNGEYMLFSSPGRIEVIGNHTDHNNGKVVAAAVSVDTLAVVTAVNEPEIVIRSEGYPEVFVDINDLNAYKIEEGTSQGLVRGVLKAFKDRGYKIGGFHTTTTSNVCKGAGMSSSAAFEVLVCEILNYLYNDCKIGAIERAVISQYAENVYFGKPSGLMDQSAISLGGVSKIDFCDTSAPEAVKLDWNFDDVSVVVVNCGGDHCDLTPQYAAIKSEMESVAKMFGKDKLRFVSENDFYSAIKTLKEQLPGRAILRAIHYYEENKRVDEFAEAVLSGNEADALAVVTESGESSYKYLQNLYPEGENGEPIPLALALAKKYDGVCAYRVHGGGFAGTILTFVKNEARDSFVSYMGNIFGEKNVFPVKIRNSGTIRIDV